jgi:Leucine-rich repeat (LRR) protein
VLKLKCSEKITDKSIDTVLRNCPQLRELSLFGCKKIKGTAFRTFVSGKSASKKRSLCLQSLNLSYCELSKKGFKTLTKACLPSFVVAVPA